MKLNLFLLIALVFTNQLFGQKTETKELYQTANAAKKIYLGKQNIDATNFFKSYQDYLGLSQSDEFVKQKEFKAKSGFTRLKYKQFYKGLPVIGSSYTLHVRNGILEKATGVLYPYINVNTIASFDKEEISAMAIVQTAPLIIEEKKIAITTNIDWQISELKSCIIDLHYPKLSGDYRLAYELILSAQLNLPLKYRVYIDANSGKLIDYFTEIIDHSVTGTAETKYYGTQSIITDSIAPNEFYLRDLTRGDGVFTHMATTGREFEEIKNEDNYWERLSDDQHQVATDAHYCASAYYDMMQDLFGWDGLDGEGGELVSVVGVNGKYYLNAFWDGKHTYYGNGNCTQYGPLTTLDIVAHEFAHGFTDFTSDLIYRNQSGALNESISDIFGKALEYYYDRQNFTWFIGERIKTDPNARAFRSMRNPNERFHPRLYAGQYWVRGESDNGGVHSNSGVLNFWFYLLVEGWTSVNEIGVAFDVNPIGMEDALQIVFGMQTGYLTPNSTYIDAMDGSLEAVIDLFGANSAQHESVVEAWKAVGLTPELNERDLMIAIPEDDIVLCPADEKHVQGFIYNVGRQAYTAGDSIRVQYLEGNDLMIHTITLAEDLTVGDSITFEFEQSLTQLSVESRDFELWIFNDELNQLNNLVRFSVFYPESDGLDLSLSDFTLLKEEACGDAEFNQFRYLIRNIGCHTLMAGDTLYFNLVADQGNTALMHILTNAITPNSSALNTVAIVSNELDPDITEYTVSLRHKEELIVDENNVVEESFQHNSSFIKGGYTEGFTTDSLSNLYSIRTSNYMKDSVINYQDNMVLAFAGTRSDLFYRACPDPDDFFDSYFYSSSLNYCVDASDMDTPVFEFSLKQFISNESNNDLFEPDFGSMLKLRLDTFDFPVIYGNAGQDFVAHQFELPQGYQGTLELEVLTNYGRLSPFFLDLESLDVVLLDDIRLFDKADESRFYNQENYALFPNPTNDILRIKSKDPSTVFSVFIYDNLGRLVGQKEAIVNQYRYDLSPLPAGLYYVRIKEGDENIVTSKVIKIE